MNLVAPHWMAIWATNRTAPSPQATYHQPVTRKSGSASRMSGSANRRRNAGVPEIWGFIKNETDRKAVELVVSQQVFSRPHVVAPETPAERVKLLRAAYDAVMVDAQFLADAEKARLDISPSPGAKLQQLVESVYATPAATVERARAIILP